VSFATITLGVASQRVFILVSVYFVIYSVLTLLDTPSYIPRISAYYPCLQYSPRVFRLKITFSVNGTSLNNPQSNQQKGNPQPKAMTALSAGV
jgi:hypothetical protein